MNSTKETTTSTSGLANKDLDATLSKLAKGISAAYVPGSSAYVAPSSTTTGGWAASLNAANNPDYANAMGGALSSYGNRAAGNELGINDPLYAAQRARLSDDIMTTTNNSFNNSGLFGSDSNQRSAARGLAEGLGALDLAQRSESYGRQAEAAGMLPQLFSGMQLPASIQQSIGASMDADKRAQANGVFDRLGQVTGLITGAAPSAGTTTSTTVPGPSPLQMLLGGGLGLAGLFL